MKIRSISLPDYQDDWLNEQLKVTPPTTRSRIIRDMIEEQMNLEEGIQ